MYVISGPQATLILWRFNKINPFSCVHTVFICFFNVMVSKFDFFFENKLMFRYVICSRPNRQWYISKKMIFSEQLL